MHRPDSIAFDLAQEVTQLITHYQKSINMTYHHSEIEDISKKPRHILGQINKYVFTQVNADNQYKIKLKNFRRAIEGVRFNGNFNMCQYDKDPKSISSKTSKNSDQKASMIQFFDELDVEVISEIDEFNKIVRFSQRRKDSMDCQDGEPEEVIKTHVMMVSYQVMNDEKACISMFEYDEDWGTINPLSFVIITQKISKLK